jgi:hypothetical protein
MIVMTAVFDTLPVGDAAAPNRTVTRDDGAAESETEVGLPVAKPINCAAGRVGFAPPSTQSNTAFRIYAENGISYHDRTTVSAPAANTNESPMPNVRTVCSVP